MSTLNVTNIVGPTGFVPIGGIIMWSGSIANIPTGWRLCNGSNGTPDLRDRFIVGAGSGYSPGNTGGNKNSVLPAHRHFVTGAGGLGMALHENDEAYAFSYRGYGSREGTSNDSRQDYQGAAVLGEATFGASSLAGSGSGINANLPPYYALAYIMRIA